MAWRSRSVVRPNDLLSRAYSSLPTRMSVSSSSRTTAASTFSRGRPGRREVRVDALADRRQQPGEGDHPLELRAVAVLAVARVVAVLLAAPGVATGRLQVAARVGADPDVRPGRRDRRAHGSGRATVASRIVAPSGARYVKPRPARRRVIPGLASRGYAQPGRASRLVSVRSCGAPRLCGWRRAVAGSRAPAATGAEADVPAGRALAIPARAWLASALQLPIARCVRRCSGPIAAARAASRLRACDRPPGGAVDPGRPSRPSDPTIRPRPPPAPDRGPPRHRRARAVEPGTGLAADAAAPPRTDAARTRRARTPGPGRRSSSTCATRLATSATASPCRRHRSLTVPAGTILGIIGPSGSGKTTTIRMLTGALDPDDGEVRVLGEDPRRFRRATRERIGYMPQLFTLYPDLTARENVDFVASPVRDALPAHARRRVREVLELVDLWDARGRRAGQLSGGMQRRLELACALVHDPALLFLDEPTAGIDPILPPDVLGRAPSAARRRPDAARHHPVRQRGRVVRRGRAHRRRPADRAGPPDELRRQAVGGDVDRDRDRRRRSTRPSSSARSGSARVAQHRLRARSGS